MPLSYFRAYEAGTGAVSGQGLTVDGRTRAAIRLRLASTGGIPFAVLPIDALNFYVKATPGVASRIYATECITSRRPWFAITLMAE